MSSRGEMKGLGICERMDGCWRISCYCTGVMAYGSRVGNLKRGIE